MTYAQFRHFALVVTFPVSFASVGVVILLFHIACFPLHDPIEAALPYASAAGVLVSPLEKLEIIVSSDGSIELMGKTVTARVLEDRLSQAPRVTAAGVVLAADSRVPFRVVKSVLSVVGRLGAERVTLRTAKIERSK